MKLMIMIAALVLVLPTGSFASDICDQLPGSWQGEMVVQTPPPNSNFFKMEISFYRVQAAALKNEYTVLASIGGGPIISDLSKTIGHGEITCNDGKLELPQSDPLLSGKLTNGHINLMGTDKQDNKVTIDLDKQ